MLAFDTLILLVGFDGGIRHFDINLILIGHCDGGIRH